MVDVPYPIKPSSNGIFLDVAHPLTKTLFNLSTCMTDIRATFNDGRT
jgi:hypothetical protein